MRAYQLYPSESAARISLLSDDQAVKSAIKTPQLLPKELSLKVTKREGDKSLPLKDVAFIETKRSLIAFSATVHEKLLDRFDIAAQWVPVDIDGAPYQLMNIVEVVDAIDVERSMVEYGPGGRIEKADELVLDESIVSSRWLFRDSIKASSVCFCTDRFFSWFKEHAFTGFSFLPAYDSDVEPFRLGPGSKYARSRPDVYGPDGFFKGYEHLWKHENKNETSSESSVPDEVTIRVVPYGNDRVGKVVRRLLMYGIEAESQENLVTLPLKVQSPDAKERTPYTLTEKQGYCDFINDVFMHAAGPDNARAALAFIKNELLQGRRDFGIDYDVNKNAEN